MGKKTSKQAPTSSRNSAEHHAAVFVALQLADALPSESVKAPDASVEELLRDARQLAAATREHQDELIARGLAPNMAATLEARADALSQTQALWMADRRKGLRKESTAALIAEAEEARRDALAIADLALRRSRDGLARLANIREGEGLADLAADLRDLSALVSDAGDAFALVNEDADVLSDRLKKLGKKLTEALASEDAGRVVSSSKDRRDRLVVLVKDAIEEVRAYARVVFRKDSTNERRGAFITVAARRKRSAIKPSV
ncbi:MAG: hypothetical protein Q8O67_20680 [Deltaproteobacteria bacterium]|nr:hypothetical protein [Deltaproteobacteria bacterium]